MTSRICRGSLRPYCKVGAESHCSIPTLETTHAPGLATDSLERHPRKHQRCPGDAEQHDGPLPRVDSLGDARHSVGHVEAPGASTKLGAKSIGEAGVIGALGAVWVAVNDALKPLGAKVVPQRFTPERVLDASV